MREFQKPALRQCLVCQLPQKRLTQINVALIVDGLQPLEVSRELGVTVKAITDHVQYCLDMPVHAGRVVQMTKQRLEIDPEEVVKRLMENLDAVQQNAENLEERAEWEKAGRLRLGLAQQLGRFMEQVMERAERVQLSKQIEDAMNAPVQTQQARSHRPSRSAGDVLKELTAEKLRES